MPEDKTPQQRAIRGDSPRKARSLRQRQRPGAHSGREHDEDTDLIYGLHAAGEALRNPRRRILSVHATRNAARRLNAALSARGIEPEIVQPRDLERILGSDAVHQGILVRATPLPAPALRDLALRPDSLLVLLDQVTDPHNVGAILRSACAFGADAVITTARHAPRRSPVMLKAASGALEHVPLVIVTNLARAIESLKEKGCTILGLDSEAPGILDCAMPLSGPVALVLGAEGRGLRQKTRSLCHALLRLDMPGPIRSLNVSNAAATALFAIVESRRRAREGAGTAPAEERTATAAALVEADTHKDTKTDPDTHDRETRHADGREQNH